MHTTNPFEGLDDYSINLIHHKAWHLTGQAGYTKSDQEDIEQELSLHLRQQLPKYNPSKGTLKTFVSTVLNNKVKTMVATRLTSRFDFRQNQYSLDEMVQAAPGEMVSGKETIDEDEYLMAMGQLNRPVLETVELRIDVQHAVSLLPKDLQYMCARLQKQTIVEIAHEDGVTRQKIDEIRRRIAFLFLEHGLNEYL